ncbi:hypothetical protein PHK61_31320 [Actinomycetospora lutea]|uniref:hypothetical protein n=1 Tax=Actinomycetospora lutea TaxID=663604 RepID=UPI0023650A90|nr:hypothetical protein [Actinomycetospora lutea]MDD7942910.1 hypothetical protein [Actinomycetospora lutea]
MSTTSTWSKLSELTWSTGRIDLRRRYAGLGRERSDEQIAEENEGSDNAIALVGDTWPEMSSRGEQPDLLSTPTSRGCRVPAVARRARLRMGVVSAGRPSAGAV